MSDEEVIVERQGAVLLVRLNRPDAMNALNMGMKECIGAAMMEAENDPRIRTVVLTGTGDRAFCAGMDLRSFATNGKELGQGDDADAEFLRLLHGTILVPVVGAANGTAVAGGFQLLLGCDIIVASSQAQFGLPETKRGLFPAGSGMFLGTRIPLSVALEMTLTGDSIDANRAYGLGLVNAVVEPDQVLATAMAYAQRIAANSPLGLAATKELVRLGVSDATRTAERMRELRPIVYGSEDAREGAAAFVEKRQPLWRGR